MRISTGHLTLLILAACAGKRAPATGVAPAQPQIEITVPDSVGAFRMLRRIDYEEAELGVQLRYQGPDALIADVFVYPGPDLTRECPAPCAKERLASEIADFERDIPEIIRRGYVESATITATEPLVPEPGAPWHMGHHLILAVTRDGRAQRSDFYLYYVPGFRVKVRATFPENERHLLDLDDFVRAVVPAIGRPIASMP